MFIFSNPLPALAINLRLVAFFIKFSSMINLLLIIIPLYFSIMTMVWFCFLSFMLTSPKLNFLFKQYDDQIEKISSTFLVFIGLLIIFNIFYVN